MCEFESLSEASELSATVVSVYTCCTLLLFGWANDYLHSRKSVWNLKITIRGISWGKAFLGSRGFRRRWFRTLDDVPNVNPIALDKNTKVSPKGHGQLALFFFLLEFGASPPEGSKRVQVSEVQKLIEDVALLVKRGLSICSRASK